MTIVVIDVVGSIARGTELTRRQSITHADAKISSSSSSSVAVAATTCPNEEQSIGREGRLVPAHGRQDGRNSMSRCSVDIVVHRRSGLRMI